MVKMIKVLVANKKAMPVGVNSPRIKLMLNPKGAKRSSVLMDVKPDAIALLRGAGLTVTENPEIKVVKEIPLGSAKKEPVSPGKKEESGAGNSGGEGDEATPEEVSTLLRLKKDRLIELCTDHDLDDSGNKTDLAWRLSEILEPGEIDAELEE